MVRIGIIADTHMFSRAKQLPKALMEGLRDVDLILHAGDWVQIEVVDMFEKIAPVDGIAGNNDGMDIISRFGHQKVIEIEGKKLGLIHGDGYAKSTEERAWMAFQGSEVDMVIFGHSHKPYIAEREGVLVFNPGSPTDKRFQPRFSYGKLEIEAGRLDVKHYYYDSKE